MPHTGLIEDNLSPGDEALLRVKLHVQSGWDRLEKGEIADAIAVFYDAFVSAMWRYFISDELRTSLVIYEEDDLAEDRSLFEILKRTRIIDASFTKTDFDYFSDLLDDVLEDRSVHLDVNTFQDKFENVMHQLGALPH